MGLVLLWLVFGGLKEKGLGYYDEAYNVMEARFLCDGVRLGTGFVASRLAGEEIGLRSYVKSHGRPGGYYPSYGKPVHSVILAGGMILTGGANWGAHLAMAVCGVVLLVALWGWSAALLGGESACWSAPLLGATAFFLIYARETLAEIDSMALMTLGLWWLAAMRARSPRHPRLSLLGAGCLFGLAFAANYRWFWIPLVMLADVLLLRPRKMALAASAPSGWSRAAWLLTGAAIPLIVAELPGLLLRWYFHRVHLPPPFETYWEQIARLYFFHPTSQKGFHVASVPTYGYLLWRWTSPVFLFFAGVGAYRLLSRRGRARIGLFLVGPPVVMLGFYSVYVYSFARFATLSLPFLAVLAGAGVSAVAYFLGRLFGPLRRSNLRRLTAALAVLAIVAGLPASLRARSICAPFPDVAEWLRARGGGLCASTDPHVMRVVYGKDRVIGIPANSEDLRLLRKQGVRWIVLGPLRRYWGQIPGVERLMNEYRPAREWKNPCVDHEQYPFEHNVGFRQARSGSLFKGLDRVEVYDLEGFSGSPEERP